MSNERTITPVLRYRDPSDAAEWLCRAFGFTHDHTSKSPDGQTHYIALRLGDCLVLVCPVANSVLHTLMAQPADLGGANTQICYLTAEDLDAHSTRALAAGARVELGPESDGAGGRFYMCRDPEGHLWSIGTRTHVSGNEAVKPSAPRHLVRPVAAVATVIAVLAGWLLYDTNFRTWSRAADITTAAPSAPADQVREAVADELARRIRAEVALSELQQKLGQETSASTRLKQELQRAQADLAQMRMAKDEAERALAQVQAARDAADQTSQAAAEALAREKTRVKAAIEAQAVLLSKAARLEAALQAEQERSIKADNEATVLRERIVQPPPPATPEPAEAVSTPPEREEVASLDSVATPPSEPPAEAAKSSPTSPCALAIQGKVPFGRKGPSAWEPASLARLCRNAETSVEPAKCFEQLMRGQVDWGGGKVWMPSNALALCAGTRDASQTLGCFVKTVAADNTWRSAIDRCRFK